MYCPSCGSELNSELIYCNRCGANLKPVGTQPGVAPTRLIGATWAISVAIALITLGGFAMAFALVMALVTRGVNLAEGALVLPLVSLLIVLAIDWLLVRQLSRVLDLAQLLGGAPPPPQPRLSEKPLPQISARHEPIPSVTEHTTRTFEPVPRKRETER